MTRVIDISVETSYCIVPKKDILKCFRVVGKRIGFIINNSVVNTIIDSKFKHILTTLWNNREKLLAATNIMDIPKSIIDYLSWGTNIICNEDIKGLCKLLQKYANIFTFDVVTTKIVVDDQTTETKEESTTVSKATSKAMSTTVSTPSHSTTQTMIQTTETTNTQISVEVHKNNTKLVQTITTKVDINVIIDILTHITELNEDEDIISQRCDCSLYKYDDYKHLYHEYFEQLPFSLSQGKTDVSSYKRNVASKEYINNVDVQAISCSSKSQKYNTINLTSAIPAHMRILNSNINTIAENLLHSTTKNYFKKYNDIFDIRSYTFNDDSNPYADTWRSTFSTSKESWQLSSKFHYLLSNIAWLETALTINKKYNLVYELPADVKAYHKFINNLNISSCIALFKSIMLKNVNNTLSLYDGTECMYVKSSTCRVTLTDNVNSIDECTNFDNRMYDISVTIPRNDDNQGALASFIGQLNKHISKCTSNISNKIGFSNYLFTHIMYSCYVYLLRYIEGCVKKQTHTLLQVYPEKVSVDILDYTTEPPIRDDMDVIAELRSISSVADKHVNEPVEVITTIQAKDMSDSDIVEEEQAALLNEDQAISKRPSVKFSYIVSYDNPYYNNYGDDIMNMLQQLTNDVNNVKSTLNMTQH